MKKYYLSLHSKEGREYEDATELKKMFEKCNIERTNNPYEADFIIAMFYNGEYREDIIECAMEMKLLELIHKKNPEAKICAWGTVAKTVELPSLYPFLTDFADGLTMSSYLRKNGLEKWGHIPVEVYDSFRDQFMETLKNAKMPKFLMMPESVDAVEEEICNWVAIDEAVNERGLKSKCDTRGFDEELSFSLPGFLKMIRRDVVRIRKGELDRLSKMLPTENIRKLAKAYK